MPKRTDIKKIMVIGSGPIVIGQAAEFDYAGTQACIALKEEGYEVILVNSNPATIMTDKAMADKVFMEPLDLEHVAKIIRKERPDGLICSIGGQTGLNLGMQLHTKGVLEECQVELLGTGYDSIAKAEDRQLFKDLCQKIGEPVLESNTAHTTEACLEIAEKIGLKLSPVTQVLIEKSIKGYKEIEFEVMRDANDNAVAICCMENLDPVGVHTGDSIVVAPSQTLTNKEYQMLRSSALKIIRALGIEGGCNVQFALDPFSFGYYVIEVNPRVSRSSALASKASGYPIARVSAKIACGLTLDEIKLPNSYAAFEPALDYIVCKVPRFPFDKFTKASRNLNTQMKATGEVMSIGRTFEEALLKAVRSLETGLDHVEVPRLKQLSDHDLIDLVIENTDERIFAVTEAVRRDIPIDYLYELTQIDRFFLEKLQNIVAAERRLKNSELNTTLLRALKTLGFSDSYIARVKGMDETDVYKMRAENGIRPVYKMIDTCAAEFDGYTPYLYSTYEHENESVRSENKKVIVLGSGPIRIGQGIEFDYSTVHAIWAIKDAGFEAIIINNNPETVSTDYTISDKLYFEPLTFEDVMNIIDFERPEGVIVALGGQTAINLAESLTEAGVRILGSSAESIALAEDRDKFAFALDEMQIPMPRGEAVFSVADGVKAAEDIGYPVLVRPSFVLGGRMMHIVYDRKQLEPILREAVALNRKHPVLIDKYILGRECEVDAVSDGREVFIPGIMEHIERAGVHSGDSMSVYPPYSLEPEVQQTIIDYTVKVGLGLKIIGPFNIQFVVDGDKKVYIIEVNPRSSRTVPFLAKTTGTPIADIATKVMLGFTLKELGYTGVYPKKKRWYVKAPTFSYSKLTGLDAVLSPEMKSTGEAIGYDDTLTRAVYKALKASGLRVDNYGTVFATIGDQDKAAALPLIRRFYDLGFNIEATEGTAKYLKNAGIRTRVRKKLSQGSDEILQGLRRGYVTYVVNTITEGGSGHADGMEIRRTAVENNVPVFTSLDTVRVLLDVLEETTMGVSEI